MALLLYNRRSRAPQRVGFVLLDNVYFSQLQVYDAVGPIAQCDMFDSLHDPVSTDAEYWESSTYQGHSLMDRL